MNVFGERDDHPLDPGSGRLGHQAFLVLPPAVQCGTVVARRDRTCDLRRGRVVLRRSRHRGDRRHSCPQTRPQDLRCRDASRSPAIHPEPSGHKLGPQSGASWRDRVLSIPSRSHLLPAALDSALSEQEGRREKSPGVSLAARAGGRTAPPALQPPAKQAFSRRRRQRLRRPERALQPARELRPHEQASAHGATLRPGAGSEKRPHGPAAEAG